MQVSLPADERVKCYVQFRASPYMRVSRKDGNIKKYDIAFIADLFKQELHAEMMKYRALTAERGAFRKHISATVCKIASKCYENTDDPVISSHLTRSMIIDHPKCCPMSEQWACNKTKTDNCAYVSNWLVWCIVAFLQQSRTITHFWFRR